MYYLLPQTLFKRIQKVQFAAASFGQGWYVKSQEDLLQIGWLLMSDSSFIFG